VKGIGPLGLSITSPTAFSSTDVTITWEGGDYSSNGRWLRYNIKLDDGPIIRVLTPRGDRPGGSYTFQDLSDGVHRMKVFTVTRHQGQPTLLVADALFTVSQSSGSHWNDVIDKLEELPGLGIAPIRNALDLTQEDFAAYDLILLGNAEVNSLIDSLVEKGLSKVAWKSSKGDIEVIQNAFMRGRRVIVAGGMDWAAIERSIDILKENLPRMGLDLDRTLVVVGDDADLVPPSVTIVEPRDGERVTGKVDVRVRATDNVRIESILLRLDHGPWSPMERINRSDLWSSTIDFSGLEDGEHALTVQAVDASGHTSSAYARVICTDTLLQAGRVIKKAHEASFRSREAGVLLAKANNHYDLALKFLKLSEFTSMVNHSRLAIHLVMEAFKAEEATNELIEAARTVDEAMGKKTLFMDAVKKLLQAARASFSAGDYGSAITLAQKTKEATHKAMVFTDVVRETTKALTLAERKLAKAKQVDLQSPEARHLLENAKATLLKAQQALDLYKISSAEEQIKKTTLIVDEALRAEKTYREVDAATQAIHRAEEERRTIGLEEARKLHEEALEAYALGDYKRATTLAQQAREAANEAKTPLLTLRELSIAVLVIVVIIGIMFYRRIARGRQSNLP
jgi:hypothetical protein